MTNHLAKDFLEKKSAIERLQEIMAMLRDKVHGCPWDLDQTLVSLIPHTIEEVYEVADAIEKNDIDNIVDELGDLLFQVIFYAQIGNEEKIFNFEDVANAIVRKLLRRHPHVFPTGDAKSFGRGKKISSDEVVTSWESIKLEEKKEKLEESNSESARSVFDNLPGALPALQKSVKLQKLAGKVGFDWPDTSDVLVKLKEEIVELEEAIGKSNKQEIESEFGDVLFTAVNMARHLNVDPELALRGANGRFKNRVVWIENELGKNGEFVSDKNIDDLNQLWNEAKRHEIELD
jgi:ATP diphosphatase